MIYSDYYVLMRCVTLPVDNFESQATTVRNLRYGCRDRRDSFVLGDDSATRARHRREPTMDWKLEVVVIPVTDIDRAKSFYTGKLGFHLDADTTPTETMRVVHMTPPGSGCSVVVGPKVVPAGTDLGGTSASLQLIVPDIEAARTELAGRGVEVSPVQTMDPRDGGKFAFFTDPDGNNWAIQEVREYVGAELSS